MFIDINYNRRPQEAKFHLAKPNKQIISHVSEKFQHKLALKLGNIHEMSFSIPFYIEEEMEQVRNPHVDIIKEKMLIRVTMGDYKDWFVVDSIEEDGDDSDIFNVTTFSLPYELKGKRISGLSEESINATALLTLLLENTIWSIGTIDPIFDQMYRSFESGDDSNILDCITNATETYGALIEWDSINRKVSFKDPTKNGSFKGMTVTYGRLLNSVKRTRSTDEMVTRMYVYGSEDLTIHSVNPTGQGYIENFDYFMYPFQRDANKNVIQSSYYMSDALCHAILDHQALISLNASNIAIITGELAVRQADLITEQSKLDDLQLELENILDLLDVAKGAEDSAGITARTKDKTDKEAEIATQKAVVTQASIKVQQSTNALNAIQGQISGQASFTPALLDELNPFIIESTWRDDNYINAQELYDDGLKKFEELRKPKIVIEASIENILGAIEEQYYWDKLVLGDLIKVKYPQMNIEYMAKIIEINYDLEAQEATLTIANTTDLLNDAERLLQLLRNSSTATSMVQNNKYKWDKINPIQQSVNSILTSEWDATKNKILAGINNTVEVGNRGIIIRNPDPDFQHEIVIMQSGVIALSKDDGETWKTAIRPDGIIAERLIGQIIAGQELIITNDSGSFTLDNNGARFSVSSFIIESSNGTNMVDKWTSTSNFVDDFTDDNVITPYEKKMLKNQFDEFETRYNANVAKINLYYAGEQGNYAYITDYYAKYLALYNYLFVELQGDKPLLAGNNMVASTRVDSSVFRQRYKDYDNALVEVEKQILIRTKNYTDDAIGEVQDNIDEVKDDVVYKTELHSTNGNVFNNGVINTTIYAVVYRGKENITANLPNSAFKWKKTDMNGVADTAWNTAHANVGSTIQVTGTDVFKKATFWCDIDIP
ncbi:phage tail spike protein [Priestia aryabhattai]|uniref:phage tail spike protein n=1 Tax=Priestia aryabhattai TaxID=412384 RepID=UPI00399F12CF